MRERQREREFYEGKYAHIIFFFPCKFYLILSFMNRSQIHVPMNLIIAFSMTYKISISSTEHEELVCTDFPRSMP